jgi:hypothetical protein
MARLPRYVIPGQPQHIIQRGNNRHRKTGSDTGKRGQTRYFCEGGINLYTYAAANPANFTDPTGEILPCLAFNYLRCFTACMALGAAGDFLTGCEARVGCADHREAHRSRSMGFTSSAHPTDLPHPQPIRPISSIPPGKSCPAWRSITCAALLSAAGDLLFSCEVDWGGNAKDCGLDCLLGMLPIPNPCGKFGKFLSPRRAQ